MHNRLYIYIKNIHITLKISSNMPIQYTKKYNNKYMTPMHQNNLGTELFLSQILKMFRLVMRLIRLSNLFHSLGAAKLKDLSKKVLEQFLLRGGITNNKSSLAERVFDELLFFFTYSDKYMGAEWSTKALKVKIRIL